MNYCENMLKFKTKKDAEAYISRRTFKSTLKKGKSDQDIFDNCVKILNFSSYMYSVELAPYAIVGYEEDGEIKIINQFDKVPGFDINKFDSFKLKPNTSRYRNTELFHYYTIRLTYHFLTGNYQKIEKTLAEIMADTELPYKNIDTTAYTGSDYYIGTLDRMERMLQKTRCYLTVLFAGKKFSTDGCFKQAFYSYMGQLRELARNEKIEEFLSNKMIALMHERVMHDYGEVNAGFKKHNFDAFMYGSISILDDFETRPDLLRDFLYQFPNDPEKDGWNKIQSADDYRIRDNVKIFKNNKERLLSIFRNYLYSKYALGQKQSRLEDTLRQMVSFMEILGFEDVNILEIVDELPEKIQRFALKAMIGE